jgi:apoptosis-inducing factor 2
VAAGATPRGEIIKTLSPSLFNPKTHSIKVKNTFQLDDPAYPNIFAAGDVADTADLKMAYKAGLHAPIIAKNIKSLLSGQEPKATYKPSTGSEMMVIPMGKMGGVSYLSFFGGFTLGNWATKQMKGKHLFVDQQKKLLVRY